jgi:hypothetical protein
MLIKRPTGQEKKEEKRKKEQLRSSEYPFSGQNTLHTIN